MRFERSSGILLHPTSLPAQFGIGDLGEHAYKFVDMLAECRQKLWQICPLGPTGYGDSPYQCFSAFAGNPLLIHLESLGEEGLLSQDDLTIHDPFDAYSVDYGRIIHTKHTLLQKAHQNFRASANPDQQRDYETFCEQQRDWLEDYALFMALKEYHQGAVWNTWEPPLVKREPETLATWKDRLATQMGYQKFIQHLFFRQWSALKAYANERDIKIVGDVPIFVAFDSADAWANPDRF
ncbi:4-alpha-glucanotransferase, partial [candidate division KSB3 bacterium]|nr:4-alpha-glucanotransferase [candidate division KSB3 bacterium]MBD3323074.1 4-alpha-glucanotransferase [candidate division KSB3 bacterium]